AIISDSDYFNAMLSSSQDLNPSYGYLWWLNGQDSHIRPNGPASFNGPIATDAPDDLVLAAGAQGQFIAISPSQNLIMIRQGQSENTDLAALQIHNEIWELLSEVIDGSDCDPLITRTFNDKTEKIKVFPMPASEQFTVKGIESHHLRSLELRTLSGKWLYSSNTDRIDVSTLPGGIYLLYIKSSLGLIIKQVVKAD
ncbi:MAG: T9SS type A sorting domain-containing protein, partial [Bacteroidota bacterium]